MPIPRRQVPNVLTLVRLVLAAAFFACLGAYSGPGGPTAWGNVAVGLFVLAAITDALDGHLARKWDAVSLFGRIMDPFCDKVLVLGAFIYLASPRFEVDAWVLEGRWITMATGLSSWMVVVILARELLVTGIRGVAESLGVAFPAIGAGKLKMILQSVGVPAILLVCVNLGPHEHAWALWLNVAIAWAMVVVTVWSGVPYVLGARRVLAANDDPPGDDAR